MIADHHRPPQNVWGGESFKINDLTPPTRLVVGKSVDSKGKNANIGGGPHFYPPLTFCVWERGGVEFVVPVNICVFN